MVKIASLQILLLFLTDEYYLKNDKYFKDILLETYDYYASHVKLLQQLLEM